MIRNMSLIVLGLVLAFAAGGQSPQAPGMKVTELGPATRTFKITFAKGDEVASGLLDFAEKNHLTNSHFTAIGALDHAVIGWYDPEKRAFKKSQIDEEVEIASFTGNVSRDSKGKPVVHAHCVVSALSDGRTMAGHFIEGHVSLAVQLYLEDSEPMQSSSARP